MTRNIEDGLRFMRLWVLEQLKQVLGGAAMKHEPEKGPVVAPEDMLDSVGAWKALDVIEKAAKERKESILRPKLLEWAEKLGSPTDKGGQELRLPGGTTLIREKRTDKLPEEKALRALLEEKGIAPNLVFDEIKTPVLNPSKLENLVKTGKLSAKDVEECKGVTYALLVHVDNHLHESIRTLKDDLKESR